MFKNLLINYSIYDSFIVKHRAERRDPARSISIQLKRVEVQSRRRDTFTREFRQRRFKMSHHTGVSFE